MKKKISVLLDKNMRDRFIEYAASFTQNEEPKKYQIFRGKLNEADIIVYKSGIVLFHPSMIARVRKFYTNYNLPLPNELSTSITIEEGENISGISSKHPSILLKKEQIYYLDKILTSDPNYQSTERITKNERARYINKQGDIIIINKNNTVYSNRGNLHFQMIKDKVIQERNEEIYIGIELLGLTAIFGPVILSIAITDTKTSNDLQLAGIKHTKISRSKKLMKFKQIIIQSNVKTKIIQIDPKEFNQQFPDSFDKNKFMKSIATKLKNVVQKLVSDAEKTNITIIVDPILDIQLDLIEEENSAEINIIHSKEAWMNSSVNAVAAISGHIKLNEWKEKIEKRTGIILSNIQISKLVNHPDASKIIKLSLI